MTAFFLISILSVVAHASAPIEHLEKKKPKKAIAFNADEMHKRCLAKDRKLKEYSAALLKVKPDEDLNDPAVQKKIMRAGCKANWNVPANAFQGKHACEVSYKNVAESLASGQKQMSLVCETISNAGASAAKCKEDESSCWTATASILDRADAQLNEVETALGRAINAAKEHRTLTLRIANLYAGELLSIARIIRRYNATAKEKLRKDSPELDTVWINNGSIVPKGMALSNIMYDYKIEEPTEEAFNRSAGEILERVKAAEDSTIKYDDLAEAGPFAAEQLYAHKTVSEFETFSRTSLKEITDSRTALRENVTSLNTLSRSYQSVTGPGDTGGSTKQAAPAVAASRPEIASIAPVTPTGPTYGSTGTSRAPASMASSTSSSKVRNIAMVGGKVVDGASASSTKGSTALGLNRGQGSFHSVPSVSAVHEEHAYGNGGERGGTDVVIINHRKEILGNYGTDYDDPLSPAGAESSSGAFRASYSGGGQTMTDAYSDRDSSSSSVVPAMPAKKGSSSVAAKSGSRKLPLRALPSRRSLRDAMGGALSSRGLAAAQAPSHPSGSSKAIDGMFQELRATGVDTESENPFVMGDGTQAEVDRIVQANSEETSFDILGSHSASLFERVHYAYRRSFKKN